MKAARFKKTKMDWNWMEHTCLCRYVNLLRENINIINRNTEPLLGTGKEAGLEVNAEKIKYLHVRASSQDCSTKSLYKGS
jgi:hypothetical protein